MTSQSDRYHADDVGCPVPSLSANVAKILLDQSPRHAWTAHPRLNKHFKRVERKDFDLGTFAHAMMLEDGRRERVMVIDAEDFRTKAAKEQRDAAYAAGLLPILGKHIPEVEAMVAAGRLQLKAHAEASNAFTGGEAEQVITWQEDNGVWCRAMLDYIYQSPIIDDYKTTGGSANPETWAAQLFDRGFDIQAAFYTRGYRKIHQDPQFRFIVQENEPPYALSIVALTPAALEMANRKVERAIELWGECLKANRWPGYPSRVAYVDPPGWNEKRWLEREERERADGNLARQWLNWQAPA